ncbi:cytochrome P450 6B5-like [Ostrinia nubilalis]|uniref:cytochrome P450 6B5-like n=1 Tax=Ostrinia nubilalis TaxID=29057 RepID=UPI0030825970
MWIILLSICVILVVWLIFTQSNKDYWKKRNVVQVNDLLVSFFRGDRSIAEIYKEVYDSHPKELYVGSVMMTKPTLILRDLQNMQAVLHTDFESFSSRGIDCNENDLLADNVLFISDYQRWKTIRQKMTPLFTSSKLKSMTNVIKECARDFVEMVKQNKEMREKPFTALYTYTTATVGASVCGIDTQVNNSMQSPFLEMSWKALEPSTITDIKFAISTFSPTLFKLLKLKIFGEHEEFFIGAMKKVLAARRNDPHNINDFIGLCMEIQKAGPMKDKSNDYELEPTDELLAAQAFFFFLAGTDTGANTMHFTLLELASNPDVLQKLHKEIDQVFEETNGEVTYDVIDKLVYLDMVVNEAMRKYPPIGALQRECVRDTVLPVGNLKVEKGVTVVVPAYAIHRDENLFPNPEKFDPERFAPENATYLPKYGYMPFGEGRRICLGSRYARIQVLSGLAYLLRSFTLKPQNYTPRFEKSNFSLRDTNSKYDLILRENI